MVTHNLQQQTDDVEFCTNEALRFSELATRVAFKGNAVAAAHYQDISRVYARRAMFAARQVAA